ncbi:MAG: GvpL/GvpF family gas vesicle protein [Thermodesulfobacteriota bacterium]
MPCLLYCLFAGQAPPPRQTPPGVGGGKVEVMGRDGLGAAFSWVDRPRSAPLVEDLWAYSKVVEAFHAQRTVIPLRYGCLCQDQAQAAALLTAGRSLSRPLLAELAGCVEMGIRALLPAGAKSEATGRRPAPPSRLACAAQAQSAERPGLAYLLARRDSHLQETQRERAEGDWPARCQAALAGLFTRSLGQGPVPAPGEGEDDCLLLWLYFLVPRFKVRAFRLAYAAFARLENTKMLLSGPWPPYSFAAPAQG